MDSKFSDPAETGTVEASNEPVGDVLDGGVAVERPLHGEATSMLLASLEHHPLFPPADRRQRRRRGASGAGGDERLAG
jgi:hypothetical protein